MTTYQKNVAQKVGHIFAEEYDQNDWGNCNERVRKLVLMELSKSFWNGVKWAGKNGRANGGNENVIDEVVVESAN